MDLLENKEDWQKRIMTPVSKKKRKTVTNIIGVDTEDNSKGKVTMGWFYDGNEYKLFSGFDEIILKVSEYIKSLQKKKKQTFFFFANNMLYDLVTLFGVMFIINRLFAGKLELFFTRGGFIFMKWGTTIWIAWQNYYRGYSVKKLGKILGVKKLETVDKATDVEYMKRDILIHYLAAKKLIDLLDINELDFGYTIGSIAIKTFRRKYLKRSVKVSILH